MDMQAALIVVSSDLSRANCISNCAVFMFAEIHPSTAYGPKHIAHDDSGIADIAVTVKAGKQVCKPCDQR